MSIPITTYVNVAVSLTPSGVSRATFGTPAFLNDHSAVSGNRILGPYTNTAAIVAAGFSTTSTFYLWADQVFGQGSPSPAKVYSINRAGGETVTDSMNAAVALDPSAFYAAAMESRTDDDLLALAAWTETQRKIAILQSNAASLLNDATGITAEITFAGTLVDGVHSLTFTGFGLASPITVEVNRTGGSPADFDAMAVALDAALDGEAGLSTVLASVDSSGPTVSVSITDGLIGTITSSAPGTSEVNVSITDGDIGSRLFALQYARSALAYHPTDGEYLDGAWMGKCLGFNLDAQKGIWSYKQLKGVPAASALTGPQVTVLRAANINYFAPAQTSAGVTTPSFTAQGWTFNGSAGAGRRIDITTTLDWLHARYEEAAINTLLRESLGIPQDNAGIHRFTAAYEGVNELGVTAKHLDERTVPDGFTYAGEQTPLILAPLSANLTATEREGRTLNHTGIVYLQSFTEAVGLSISASQ